MLAAIKTRLEGAIPDLADRVQKAGDFARVMRSGAAPNGGVNAFLLPSGISGAQPDVAVGAFRQPITRTLTVVLMLQATDARGERALDRVEDLIDEICAALCGWAPGDEVGVFALRSARVAPGGQGLLSYLIEFSIDDQLRILS